MTPRKISLLWADGALTTGTSYADLERSLRSTQWDKFKSRHDFREELRYRASVLTGRRVRAYGSAKRFLTALADAGLFMIVEETSDPKEVRS